MQKNSVLSTVIDTGVKEAITAFCQMRGLKLRYLIEQALIEQMEDAVDLEDYQARRSEKTVPFSKVLRRRKKKG